MHQHLLFHTASSRRRRLQLLNAFSERGNRLHLMKRVPSNNEALIHERDGLYTRAKDTRRRVNDLALKLKGALHVHDGGGPVLSIAPHLFVQS